MSKLKIIFFLIIFFPATKFFAQTEAAQKVFNDIIYLKSQAENFNKGKPADFMRANSIANLSGIYPEKWDGNYFGIFYTPTNEEIDAWLKWFEENDKYLSYYDNSDDKYKLQDKIIQLTLPNGTVRYSYDKIEMETYKKFQNKENE